MRRSRRYCADQTHAESVGTRRSADPKNQRSGSPAKNSIAPAITKYVNAVPKSGSRRTRPAGTATRPRTGRSVRVGTSISPSRRERSAASAITSATFVNSDGCTDMKPSASQRRAPFTGARKRTTTSAATRTVPRIAMRRTSFRRR